VGGQIGGTLALHYAASKAALISLTRSLARHLAPHGVTCNAVSPGLVGTEMIAGEIATEEGRAKLASIPVGRMSSPEEVAALVAFLASEEAATLTGQTVAVNGGLYLG
jgi:acetoacetyl-CoA reductase/3-oxoacyl-[acyl-carrier protein] reductase